MSDIFSKDKRSQIMSRVKSKNTDIELILRKALTQKGYRYRLHYKIEGSPDIVFTKQKIAIFCDGDFWHGKNFKKEKTHYKTFWVQKIEKNIKRDKTVNSQLRKKGWVVIRFGKDDLKKNLSNCILHIEQAHNM